MPVNADLVAQCLQPIAGDQPAGVDLRYDVRLNAIKEARREENLPGSERKFADWPAVVAETSKLLGKETKDLQLAAWLTEALMRQQGFGGLATGLTVMQGLLDQFWEGVHPVPEDDDDLEVRVGPLEWVGSKLALPVRLLPLFGGFSLADMDSARQVPTEAETEEDYEKRDVRKAAIDEGRPTPEAVAEATAAVGKVPLRAMLADLTLASSAIDALDATCDARFGNLAPGFGALRTALEEPRRLLQFTLTQRLETDPDPIVEEEEVGSDLVGGGAVDPDAPITPEPSSVADASARIAVVTRWLRQRDATNPSPYLMLRGFRWGELRATAPEVEPRLLEAPPTALRARLKMLLLDGKWPELLEQGEALMATPAGRGWLDLQRYVLTACAQLGSAYDPVAAAVRSELRALLVALPQLSRMTLMDDTPTANEETREWIEGEILADAPTADEPLPEDAAADDEPSDGSEMLSEALEDDVATARLGGFQRARGSRARRAARDPFDLALAELSQNRPTRAIELLMQELTRDQSPRGRFVRQTQIAYVMVEARLDSVARPILERLVETIEERGLDQWEAGPLVAQPLALLCRVLQRAGDDDRTAEELYLRVCRLDPMQAIALKANP